MQNAAPKVVRCSIQDLTLSIQVIKFRLRDWSANIIPHHAQKYPTSRGQSGYHGPYPSQGCSADKNRIQNANIASFRYSNLCTRKCTSTALANPRTDWKGVWRVKMSVSPPFRLTSMMFTGGNLGLSSPRVRSPRWIGHNRRARSHLLRSLQHRSGECRSSVPGSHTRVFSEH